MKIQALLSRKSSALIASGMVAFAALGIAPDALSQEILPTANLISQLGENDEAKLTIHKLKGSPTGTNPWGTTQTGVAGDPMDGVVFDIYRVKDINLSTIDGWKAYDALSGTDPNALIADTGRVEKVGSVTTANGGVATFTGKVGVYVIKENLGASTAVQGTYAPAAPFITSLPFTTQNGANWNKDVHVYPKNQEQRANKTVKDQGKHAQQSITYTLDGTVPPIPSTHPASKSYFDGYSLVDIYDPTKWTPDTGSIKVSIVNGADTTELVASDFQVSTPGAYTAEQGKNAFSISLTRAGLNKLEAVARTTGGAKVVASVDGVLASGLVSGDVVNKGVLFPPNIATPNWQRHTTPDQPNNPPTEKNPPVEVVSKYGKLNVTKVSSRDANKKLAGATFHLHKCENNNTAGGQGKLLAGSTPLTVGGVSAWTTNDQGQFSITGIQLEDWFDGSAQTDSFDYCLVETKAPEGFELLPKPILVPINQATLSSTLESTITNVPSSSQTFKLPSTGEWGRWWLIAGGTVALIAALIVTYNATRRGKKEA